MGERDSNGRFGKGNQLARGHKTGGGRPNLAKELDCLAIHQGEPRTESEVRERFRILNEIYRLFKVIVSQELFPDFVLETSDGRQLRVEAEVLSSHFKQHGHNAEECDLIICWRHNWHDAPIPVLPIMHFWYAYRSLSLIPMDQSEIWNLLARQEQG